MTKSKDRYSRLGLGKTEPVLNSGSNQTIQDHFVSRYTAAWLFLDAVAERYPDILTDLDRFFDQFPVAPQGRGEELKETQWLRTWCQGHRLYSDLVLRAAWKTTSIWRTDPISRRQRKWVFPEIHQVASDSAEAWQRTLQRDSAHFIWLADYLIGQKSYSSIAKDVGRSVPTVREALMTLAGMIELKLPTPHRGGRPRGHRR